MCLKNYENDLIGRALCEASLAPSAWYLTLTYDDDRLRRGRFQHCGRWKTLDGDPRQAKHIQKADLQNFFKRLRRKGHNLRYVAAGENGTKNTRRSHFHVIAMWQGMPPRTYRYWNGLPALAEWPWGHVDIETTIERSAVRYVAKYLTKSRRTQKRAPAGRREFIPEGWVTYSKKPLLGYEFVKTMAAEYAADKLMPRNLRYQPPGGNPKHHYSLYGKAEDVFLDELFGLWPEAVHAPKTQWMRNATLRWKKTKATNAFNALTPQKQQDAIAHAMRSNGSEEPEPLTRSEIMRRAWEDHHALVRGKKWLADLETRHREDAERLRREILHRFGFLPDMPPDPLTAVNLLRALLEPPPTSDPSPGLEP